MNYENIKFVEYADEERAAIYEFDAKYTREEANLMVLNSNKNKKYYEENKKKI